MMISYTKKFCYWAIFVGVSLLENVSGLGSIFDSYCGFVTTSTNQHRHTYTLYYRSVWQLPCIATLRPPSDVVPLVLGGNYEVHNVQACKFNTSFRNFRGAAMRQQTEL